MTSRTKLLLLVITILMLAGCSTSGGSLPTTPSIPGTPSNPVTPSNPPAQPGDTGNKTQTGTIMGSVTDERSGLKLWNGTVEVNGKQVAIKDGQFQVDNLPFGTYTLKVSKTFYTTRSVQVVVNNKATVVDVKMATIYTAADLDLFARLVHAEAKGEPYRGQVAVAATVLNRVRHRSYPNTLRGVITQVTTSNGIRYFQYEPVKNGAINRAASTTARHAVNDALAGWDPTSGATGFFAHAKVAQWQRGRRPWVWQQWDKDPHRIRIGNHSFFR